MPQNFIGCDRAQSMLLPPDLTEWVPDDHVVWSILGAVEQMDLSGFYGAYRENGQGRAAYEPSMMGWIQLVVATLDEGGLRWAIERVRGIVLLPRGRGPGDVRLLGVGSIGFGSGRRS